MKTIENKKETVRLPFIGRLPRKGPIPGLPIHTLKNIGGKLTLIKTQTYNEYMNKQMIKQNGGNAPVLEHGGVRVMTTTELARNYKVEAIQLQQNYNNNKQRFQEGKHYFIIKGEELKEILRLDIIEVQNPSKVRQLYAWTERGAARHAKMLKTDEAWDVFEKLEDTYFKVQQIKKAIPQLSRMDLINLAREAEQERLKLAEENHKYQLETRTLNREAKVAKPKIEFFDATAKSEGDICLTDFFKSIQVKPKKGFEIMKMLKAIFKRSGVWHPSQHEIDCGRFKERSWQSGERTGTYAVITPKGRTHYAEKILRIYKAEYADLFI